MRILRTTEDLESFIKEESDGNDWMERELRADVRPEEYPCAVFTHWGESANGMFLIAQVVTLSQLSGHHVCCG